MKKLSLFGLALFLAACQSTVVESTDEDPLFFDAQELLADGAESKSLTEGESIDLTLQIDEPGRYAVQLIGSGSDSSEIWIEDYINNTDDRTYNITGAIRLNSTLDTITLDGSPLDTGAHP